MGGKKSIKKESLHDLAVRLCEGDTVEFNGLYLKSNTVSSGNISCWACQMYGACTVRFSELCMECDLTDHKTHHLEFAEQRNKT